MAERFMKIRRIVIPTLTLIIMASQFMGCAATTQEETLNMLHNNKEIEVEVADLDDEYTDTGTEGSSTTSKKDQANSRKEPEIEWTELASLNTVPEIREAWDTAAGIQKTDKGKEGMFYTNSKGENDNNNTLMQAMNNNGTLKSYADLNYIERVNTDPRSLEPILAIREYLAKPVMDNYIDIDDADKAILAGLNLYYNLIPNTEDKGESNIDTSLSRKEFMSMVYRADTPVQETKQDKEFTEAVGKSAYNEYAQNLKNNSYLTIESGDLNPTTYDGAISKAEAIYMLVNRYYRDELVETSSKEEGIGQVFMFTEEKPTGEMVEITFTDAKLNKDLKDKGKLDSLNEALKDADVGLSPELYGSLVIAVKHNIINPEEDTCWDETVSTAEAMELLINTYSNMPEAMVEAGANTEVFVTKEEQEEAEIEQLKEEYKQAVASGEVGSTDSKAYQALIGLIHKSPEEYAGNAGGLYPGYNLEIDSNGVHYLVSVMDSSAEIHIGEFTVQGVQYIGEEGCDADYVYWIRFCNPGLDKTDEEIIAGRH